MSDAPVSRRTFLGTTGAAIAGATALTPSGANAAPMILRRAPSKPVVVASANGIRGVAKAFDLVTKGSDTLDAIIEGVKIQELDPSDSSVGYGGLPNAEGVVQLDASCMHGPSKRAGAVACIEGIKTPSEVAKLVMKYTPHVMLAGLDAQRFAVSFGFKVEDLLTPSSREAWLRWRANLSNTDNYLSPNGGERMAVPQTTGTINMNVVAPNGDISSVTTTSGLSYKVPGRVGDSPIIGAGQYTDNLIGAAGSTGLGEANIMVCGAFLTVEHMRRGMHPKDACMETLKRVIAMTPARLLNPNGRPTFGLNFQAVNKEGVFGGASIDAGRYAVCDEKGPRLEDFALLKI